MEKCVRKNMKTGLSERQAGYVPRLLYLFMWVLELKQCWETLTGERYKGRPRVTTDLSKSQERGAHWAWERSDTGAEIWTTDGENARWIVHKHQVLQHSDPANILQYCMAISTVTPPRYMSVDTVTTA